MPGAGGMRGNLVDLATQHWVRLTGRTLPVAHAPWLDGPVGSHTGIGADVFETYASARGLRASGVAPVGLLPSLDVLRHTNFDPSALAPAVAHFYTHTSEYRIDAWSQWAGLFWPFGWALAMMFSRRLQQLNVPLRSLDTSAGMTSKVVKYVDESNAHLFTGWVRQFAKSGHVIYAGAYGSCRIPEDDTPCVRVVFPLPNGNATVLMRPSVGAGGSLTLTSAGSRFGCPGFYFTVHDNRGRMHVRYLKTMRETIHVYPAGGDVRADHVMTLWKRTFLRIHYRLSLGAG